MAARHSPGHVPVERWGREDAQDQAEDGAEQGQVFSQSSLRILLLC